MNDLLSQHTNSLIEGRLLLSVDDLCDVMACDYEALIRNGLNRYEVAAALQILLEKTVGRGTQDRPFKIGQLRTWTSYRDDVGLCPFGCSLGTIYDNAEVHVSHVNKPLTVTLTARTLHLIGEHEYFGGPGSEFRISPDDSKRIVNFSGIYSF